MEVRKFTGVEYKPALSIMVLSLELPMIHLFFKKFKLLFGLSYYIKGSLKSIFMFYLSTNKVDGQRMLTQYSVKSTSKYLLGSAGRGGSRGGPSLGRRGGGSGGGPSLGRRGGGSGGQWCLGLQSK